MAWGGPVITPSEITPTGDAQWSTSAIDVKNHGVPSGASGVVIDVREDNSGGPYQIGARPADSSDSVLLELSISNNTQLYCAVDSNDEIEIYCEDLSECTFRITWYFGDEVYFHATPSTTKIDCTSGSWQTGANAVDISSYVQDGDTAAAAILLVNDTNVGGKFGLRCAGSSESLINGGVINAVGAIVPISSDKYDYYAQYNTFDIYFVGYIKANSGWAFGTTTPLASDSIASADPTYTDLTQQSGKTGGLFRCITDVDSTTWYNLRKNGDAHTYYYKRPGGKNNGWFIRELDANGYAEVTVNTVNDSPIVQTWGVWAEPTALYDDVIDQDAMTKNTYVYVTTVAPTDDTLTVTISAAGSAGSDVVVADNVGIVLAE